MALWSSGVRRVESAGGQRGLDRGKPCPVFGHELECRMSTTPRTSRWRLTELSVVASLVREIQQVVVARELFEVGRLVLVVALALDLDAPDDLEIAVG